MRRLVVLLFVLVVHALSGCSGGTARLGGEASETPAPHYLEVVHAPLRVTLPDGRVIALADTGVITVDDAPTWRLELDGRLVAIDGTAVATLLPDGRISHRGTLSTWRVIDDRVLDEDTFVASLTDSTLALAADPEPVHVPTLGVTPESRATLLYVIASDRLERARAATAAAEAEADSERTFFRVPVDDAPALGPADALVTIVSFEDFQCPFCSRANPTLSRIVEHYGADVRIVYRHRILPFHQNAMPAAEAASEALAQRGPVGFWAMHDLLFENQASLGRADLDRYAASVGLDMTRFANALDQHTHRAAIEAQDAAAQALGVTGTPTFFVNGVELLGAQPYDEFHRVIEEELTRARGLVARGVPRRDVYATVTRGGRTTPSPEVTAVRPSTPRPQPDPRAVYRVPIEGAPVLGAPDALVTVVVVSDFQCPFCARVEPTLARLREQYGRELRLVWLDNPLPFHDNAMPAAEAAMEIFAQTGARGFWAFHDLLFQNQQTLDRATLERLAATIRGVRMPRLRAALDQHTHRAAIEADQALARRLGASGTPSFFINGRNLRGAQPLEAFRTLIDEQLVEARARVASGTPRARLYETLTASGAHEPVFLPSPDAAPPTPAPPPAPAPTPSALPTPPTPPDVAAPPPNAQRTASGLASRVLAPGTGSRRPAATDRVVVHYSGWTTDGHLFDTSVGRGDPPTFALTTVIPGFAEGVQLMVVGERRRVWIPEALAYRGRPSAPQGMLVFDIELFRIEP